MRKTIIFIGMAIGSYAGSCIPLIWGGSLFSMSSILFGGLGALAGIYVAFRLSVNLE